MKPQYLVSILLGLAFPYVWSLVEVEERESEQEEKEYPSEWFLEQRAYPYGRIPPDAYHEAVKTVQDWTKNSLAVRGNANWVEAGPLNIGGRITALAIHPSAPQTIFIGAASGGIFRTTNNGQSWQPLFDAQPALSFGDVEIAPSNSRIVYAGTGEPNGGGGSINYEGTGIYKSISGGLAWQESGLSNVGSIGRIAIDPTNANRVFVAAMGYLYQKSEHRGIYRTTNGGASWTRVLYVSDSTGGIDLAINPRQPDTIFAAMWERTRTVQNRNYGGPTGGIFRSFNGGTTWEKLVNGLPTDDFGRIGLAMSESNPSVIYALMTNKTGFFKGIYRSNNNGTSWEKLDPSNQLVGMFSSFGWWMCRIAVDPKNPERVYALGLDVHRSDDGGKTWRVVSRNVHVDQHAIWINPNDSKYIVLGNDGGLYQTTDDATNWKHFKNLPITQFYTCEVDEKNPQRLYGGTQDNGTPRTLTGRSDDWNLIFGGDGFVCLVDPTDNRYVYAESQFGNIGRSVDGGVSFEDGTQGIATNEKRNWNTPIVFDPKNSATLFMGATRVYRSDNRAVSWTAISPDLTTGANGTNGIQYGTITSISVSPVNSLVIFAGTDDSNVWITKNGGTRWEKINTGLPNRYITKVVADPFDVQTAYVTVSGFRWREYVPHVFKTTNSGATWVSISNNLPDAPVNDLIVDPSDRNTLYIATDVGVFTSTNGGGKWQLLGNGMPIVPVLDIRLHQPTRKLIAGTYGRSMYTIQLLFTPTTDSKAISFSLKMTPSVVSAFSVIELKTEKYSPNSRVEIADLNGRLIKTLFSGSLTEGEHTFLLNRNEMPAAGIYLCRAYINGQTHVTKFFIL